MICTDSRGDSPPGAGDQWQAARREAAAVVGRVADRSQLRAGDDEALSNEVEALVRELCARPAGATCAHVASAAFLTSPRPVVLDVPRRFLACVGDCHRRMLRARRHQPARQRACLRCGAALVDVGDDGLLMAQGSVIVLARVCRSCRRDLAAASRPTQG